MIKKIITISLLFLVYQISLSNKLIFASDIIRHGARTSTQYIPNLNYPLLWNSSNIPPGQLTQYGYNMERQNGFYLKNNYSSLLRKNYDSSNICIVSDGSNRDIMSAIGIVSGIFPNIIDTSIIDIIPKESDPMLNMNKNIKSIDTAQGWLNQWKKISYLSATLLNNNYITSEQYCTAGVQAPQKAYECLQPIAKFAGQIIPLNDYCLETGCSVLDTFKGLTNLDIKNLIDTFNFNSLHNAIPTNDNHFDNLNSQYLQNSINSNGAVVISQIIYNMQAIINSNKSHPKLIIYVGHDTGIRFNIGYLLSKTNSTKKILSGNPGYGADLSFKLYKNIKNYNVIVSYRQSYKNTNSTIVFKGSFKKFKETYFNPEELNKQNYKNCGSFQLIN